MRRPSSTEFALILAAGLSLAAGAAAAQSWGHDNGYGHARERWNAAPSAFDWRSQLDRPGDYRCDAYWDANRTDCGERWRDQRHRTSRASWDTGYGYGHRPQYGYGQQPYGYGQQSYGYGRGYGEDGRYAYGYGHQSGGTTYDGAYGRPDVVFPGGGHGGYRPTYGGGRDPGRIDWCRANYRSYDPYSGYYRGYSGRLIFCG